MSQVGFVGAGRMGAPMVRRLIEAGHEVSALGRSVEKRRAVSELGAQPVTDLADVGADADVVVVCVFTDEQVQQVCLESVLLSTMRPGAVLVVHTTGSPRTAEGVAAEAGSHGVDVIDAPVSGGPKGAITATMTMVIGGADADVAAVEPILADMSAKRVHVGSVGAGHVCKLINNLLCAAHLLTAAEAMRIARDAEVDPARLLEGLNAGSGRSGVTLVNLPTWVLNGAFDSGFTMALMRKDVRLAAELIARLGLDLPIAAETARIWSESAGAIGDGEDFNRIVETQLGRM